MTRAVPEWRGRTDDSPLPTKVKLRVLEREGRICRICGNPIAPGDGCDFHHDPPLADGGEHRESRIFPVHRKCHRLITAREAQQRAESRATIASHYGLKKPRQQLRSRGFDKAAPQHSATRPLEKT